ncbi:MAG: hypothetical protein WC881_03450 [Elusimicrobiota bacterium]
MIGLNARQVPRLCLLAVCLSALGCGRRAYFPIGIFHVSDPASLPALRQAGFDAVQTYDRKPGSLTAFGAAARKAKMTVLAHPQEIMAAGAAPKGYPVAAWYLQDEPDVTKTPAAELCALNAKVGAWAPGMARAFVVGDGAKAVMYKDCGDILMVDWYPVPHRPLESAGEHVRMAVEAAGGKPVWAVLQAANWKDYAQRDPKKPRIGRFPSWGEIRFMTYHAILAGAQGIWYFAYTKPDGKVLSQDGADWGALVPVVGELAAMQPIFERGQPACLPFPPDPDGALAKAWRYLGRDYVIIANPKPRAMKLVPEEMLRMHWRPLFETRRYQKELLAKVGEGYYLRPYQVLVFEGRLDPFKSRIKVWK